MKKKDSVVKIFQGWRKIVERYLRVKEYIIHKVCLQKMTAKHRVFKGLKQHTLAIKDEHKKWVIAVGFWAARLLGSSLT